MIQYMKQASPLGPLLLAATEGGISGVYFAEHRHFKGPQEWQRATQHPLLQRAATQLEEYFAGQRQEFDVPLDLRGTPFQLSVWRALCGISFGCTKTYGEHARDVGNPKAVRAVGAAIGRNPLSIIVPCHRVMGASRSLTGYAGGLERKRALLALEGVTPD
jgi:methylated-DNA-[protein]-cysteine S-methyltransferase